MDKPDRRARPLAADKFWQQKAAYWVYEAIRRGVLQHPTRFKCTDCERQAGYYDHRDYARPLDVEPVCGTCNKLRGTASWPCAADYCDFVLFDHK